VLPFAGFVKRGDPTGEEETGQQNQLLSVFARIAPAGARAEFYGEYLREDHNSDWRDFAVEPDHVSAFTFGFRRAFQASDSSFGLITIEAANARISHLDRLRSQSPMYRHTHVRQGHTHRGQPLGAYQIPGGGGVAFRYDAVKRRSSSFALLEIRRTVQTDEGGTWGDRNLAAVLLTVGRARRARGLEIEWSAGAQHHVQTRTLGNLSLELSVRRLRSARDSAVPTSSPSDSR
jgi:hypothetical protein